MDNNGLLHDQHDVPALGTLAVHQGSETGDEHVTFPSLHDAEKGNGIFQKVLRPDDSYTQEGIYWADLPYRQRAAFVAATDAKEAAKECNTIWSMFRRNPLSPFAWYCRNAVLPGAGLGLEGYVLFSIGNLMPLFEAAWPNCWNISAANPVCDPQWVNAVHYLEVVGIIVGQILVGILGDWLGRRYGLIQNAVIMELGLLWLLASWGISLNDWVITYGFALFFYGIGVGGEYPMTATAAMENSTSSGRISSREDRLHRGRKVCQAFLMQGWGQFWNLVFLIILLLISNHGSGDGPYNEKIAQIVFRVSFALPAIGTLWLVWYRVYKMPLASKQLDAAKKKSNVTGYDMKSLGMTCAYFGSRLFGAAGTWFCNDVFFYGNKLFQGEFIRVLSPGGASLMTIWLWSLLNTGVSLAGYYEASLTIDNKLYGRKWMMLVGFLMDFILFIIPAFHFDYFTSPAGVHAFQAMYFLSSFFNQFGPNSVTFLLAAEVFPTPVRASAHGFCAAIGKTGALVAAAMFANMSTATKLLVVPWFGLAGMVITFIFIPDTTGLDLDEQERRWKYIRAGRREEYYGVAIHPKHLSLWERWAGIGRLYNPTMDLQAKIQDMREEWEVKMAEREEVDGEDWQPDLDEEYSREIHEYFRGTRVNSSLAEKKELIREPTDPVNSPVLLPASTSSYGG